MDPRHGSSWTSGQEGMKTKAGCLVLQIQFDLVENGVNTFHIEAGINHAVDRRRDGLDHRSNIFLLNILQNQSSKHTVQPLTRT